MWQRQGFKKRARYLLKAREYLLNNLDDFAQTITLDNGKPLTEALTSEIYPVADLIYHYANQAQNILKGQRLPVGVMGLLRRSSYVSFQPIGVIGVISPWNYPFSIPVGEVVMALLCGNTVCLKPSSVTPLVGEKIGEMFNAAGLPRGVFQVLSGGAEVGTALIESGVNKLLFTGSEEVGKIIMAKCAETVTPLVLELGGKDPMIVRHDADLELASSGAVWGAFTNSGQCCASVERVFVHESIFDQFVEMVVEKTSRLKQGNGLDPTVDIGPMTTRSQLKVVEQQVDEAKERGATVHFGGERNEAQYGYFYLPTIITGVDHSYSCVCEETFGPLMPIMPFSSDRQAIRLANYTRYGLTASIWTKNYRHGQKMAGELRTGTVMINECVYTHALSQTPWGGCKASGFGRTHSRFGLQELVALHHVHTNKLNIKDFWWYPYSQAAYDNIKQLTKYRTGSIKQMPKSWPAFYRLLLRKKI
jgi:succinate-semialdehyde dehydrogenase/glutarate-semialdehyde dehydrogenase